MVAFGERLKILRLEKKVTQKELAAKFQVAESAISMYERNERTPSHDLTKRIANYFGVSIDYLLGNSDSMMNNVSSTIETMMNFPAISEQTAMKETPNDRFYKDGGKGVTDEQREKNNEIVDDLRNRINIVHPDGFKVHITEDENKYIMEQLKMYRAFKKQEKQ
jgi:transcriptional regulator with XRE-family HTH domain